MSVRLTRVAHGLRTDSRRTTIDHAVCFAREQRPCDLEFVNLFGPRTTSGCSDLLIVTYELLALRNTPYWPYLRREIVRLAQLSNRTIFFPQDDYTMCGELDDLYMETQPVFVFSPITRDLDVLYPRSTAAGIQFREALTGYLSDDFIETAAEAHVDLAERSIDVGQRVRRLSPIFGQKAQAKAQIAIDFGKIAESSGFKVDISTRPEDVLLGGEWQRFLLDSRFTVGRLGGASVCDPHGRLSDRFRRRQARHPEEYDDESGRNISWRGARYGDFSAISPRIFEAAALGVCQILVEGHYVDGLMPDEHFLPLSADLSNIQEVLKNMKDLSKCQDIANRARTLLVASGSYTYRSFTNDFWRSVGFDEAQKNLVVREASDCLVAVFDNSIDVRELFKRLIVEAVITKQKLISVDVLWSALKNSELVSRSNASDLEAIELACNTWLEGVRRGEMPVESLIIPWEPASIAAPDLNISRLN